MIRAADQALGVLRASRVAVMGTRAGMRERPAQLKDARRGLGKIVGAHYDHYDVDGIHGIVIAAGAVGRGQLVAIPGRS